MTPKTPRLTPATLKNEQAVTAAIDALLIGEAETKTRRRKILRLQKALHALVGEDAWQRYLAIEEAVNERNMDELVRVAAWAFKEGLRCRR